MTFLWLANTSTLIKITIFFGVWMGLWMPIAALSALALNWRPPQPLNQTQKLILLASLYGIAPIVLWKISQVEGQSFADYGLAWRFEFFRSIILGFGLATISLIVLFGLQFSMGWLHLGPQHREGQEQPSSPVNLDLPAKNRWVKLWQTVILVLPILLIAFWISSTEELIFRGFLQKQLQQEYSVWVATLIASTIFALSHLLWELRHTFPQLPGLGLMGMVLTLACISNGGSLGVAIGLHAGWIWGMSSLDTLGGVTATEKVPEWVTGLRGQPLAGVSAIVMLFLVAAVLDLSLR